MKYKLFSSMCPFQALKGKKINKSEVKIIT